MASDFDFPRRERVLARASDLSLVIELDRGVAYEELPIRVTAGAWALAQVSEQGVLVLHPEPDSQACKEFLLNSIQLRVRRTGQVMWVCEPWAPTCTRIEADAIHDAAESPLARHHAMIDAMFEKHQ